MSYPRLQNGHHSVHVRLFAASANRPMSTPSMTICTRMSGRTVISENRPMACDNTPGCRPHPTIPIAAALPTTVSLSPETPQERVCEILGYKQIRFTRIQRKSSTGKSAVYTPPRSRRFFLKSNEFIKLITFGPKSQTACQEF